MTADEVKKMLAICFEKTRGTSGALIISGIHEYYERKGYLTEGQQALLRRIAVTGSGRPEGPGQPS